jgi:hypothetical protein
MSERTAALPSNPTATWRLEQPVPPENSAYQKSATKTRVSHPAPPPPLSLSLQLSVTRGVPLSNNFIVYPFRLTRRWGPDASIAAPWIPILGNKKFGVEQRGQRSVQRRWPLPTPYVYSPSILFHCS